jgi:hypothetical protein
MASRGFREFRVGWWGVMTWMAERPENGTENKVLYEWPRQRWSGVGLDSTGSSLQMSQ